MKRNALIENYLFWVFIQIALILHILPAQAEQTSFDGFPGGDLAISEMEFIDQPIAEIIISLAQLGKLSLLPDQSITGSASYYFRNITLEQALYQILEDNNLHLISSGPVWLISPIGLWISEDESVNLEVEDVRISDILNALSKNSFTPIRFSSLPAEKTSLYIKNAAIEEIVNILLQPYPEYQVINEKTHINIINTRNPNPSPTRSTAEITKTETGFSIYGKNLVVTELLQDLFGLEKKDILMFNQNNPVIQELRLTNRSFEEILTLITSVTGLYYREHLEVFAFFQDKPERLAQGHFCNTLPYIILRQP